MSIAKSSNICAWLVQASGAKKISNISHSRPFVRFKRIITDATDIFKSTRWKIQGIFKMCLKSHFAPAAMCGTLHIYALLCIFIFMLDLASIFFLIAYRLRRITATQFLYAFYISFNIHHRSQSKRLGGESQLLQRQVQNFAHAITRLQVI